MLGYLVKKPIWQLSKCISRLGKRIVSYLALDILLLILVVICLHAQLQFLDELLFRVLVCKSKTKLIIRTKKIRFPQPVRISNWQQ